MNLLLEYWTGSILTTRLPCRYILISLSLPLFVCLFLISLFLFICLSLIYTHSMFLLPCVWKRIWYLGCHSVLHSFIPCVCHMHYWSTSLCDNSRHMHEASVSCDSLIANLMYSLLQLHSNRKTKGIVFIKAALR